MVTIAEDQAVNSQELAGCFPYNPAKVTHRATALPLAPAYRAMPQLAGRLLHRGWKSQVENS